MEKCGIYQIWCNRSGKFYVGSSKNIYKRWWQHRNKLRKGDSGCRGLQRAWNKYGEEAFRFSILEECAEDELEKREQFFIDTLKPAYNMVTDVERRYGKEMWERRAAALRALAEARTHCPHGHPYDETNTYRGSQGERICRICNAERVKAVFARETPEQREARRIRAKKQYERTKAEMPEKLRQWTANGKDKKREYDRAHRAEATARKREARQNETPEQREKRLAAKRASHERHREANIAKMREHYRKSREMRA